MPDHHELWRNSPYFISDDDEKKKEIYENQLNFMKEHNIQKTARCQDYWNINFQELDHTRVFLAYKNYKKYYIVVRSEYNVNKDYAEEGWIKVDYLYHQSANSWVKYFPYSKREFYDLAIKKLKNIELDEIYQLNA